MQVGRVFADFFLSFSYFVLYSKWRLPVARAGFVELIKRHEGLVLIRFWLIHDDEILMIMLFFFFFFSFRFFFCFVLEMITVSCNGLIEWIKGHEVLILIRLRSMHEILLISLLFSFSFFLFPPSSFLSLWCIENNNYSCCNILTPDYGKLSLLQNKLIQPDRRRQIEFAIRLDALRNEKTVAKIIETSYERVIF